MIPSDLKCSDRSLTEMNSCIAKVSETIRNLHKDCSSDMESDVLLAELKTEKLKTLAAKARTQALLAEMEMVKTAQRLKQQISKAKLGHQHAGHAECCKCSSQQTPTKNNHKSPMKKLYTKKNTGKVQKPVKYNVKLFTNSKYKDLLVSEQNIEANAKKVDIKKASDNAKEKQHTSSAAHNAPNKSAAKVSNSQDLLMASINKSLVNAASLALYKPPRAISTQNSETHLNTKANSQAMNLDPVSSKSFNTNVSKFFGSNSAKAHKTDAKNIHSNGSKASADRPNVFTAKNVFGPNATDEKTASQTIASSTKKPYSPKADSVKSNLKPTSVVNKNTGSARSTTLTDIDKVTSAKENKDHKHSKKSTSSHKKRDDKHKTRDNKDSKKAEKSSSSKRESAKEETSRNARETGRKNDVRMDIEYPKSKTSKSSDKNKTVKETVNFLPKKVSVNAVVRMDTDHSQDVNTPTTIERVINKCVNETNKSVAKPIGHQVSFNKNGPAPNKMASNPNETVSNEKAFNPNGTVPNEKVFNPLETVSQEEALNVNGPIQNDKLFNPNGPVQNDTVTGNDVYNIFAKGLVFDKVEIIDCEPMDVDSDESFKEETMDNIRKEILKMSEGNN